MALAELRLLVDPLRRALILTLTLALLLAAGQALAQPSEPRPEQLRTLTELLRDPAIQAWLQAQSEGTAAEIAAAPAGSGESASAQQIMAGWLDTVRAFLRTLVAAVPTLPDELKRVSATLSVELKEHGVIGVVVLFSTFAALGFGVQWLFWWATTGMRERMIASDLESAKDRARALGLRLIYGMGVLLAFAIGSVGAFLLFDWPPLLKEIVLAYLLLFLIVEFVLVLGRVILAPAAERFRVVPMTTEAARFWFTWSAVLVGWFVFLKVSLNVLADLGMSRPPGYLIALLGSIVLLALTLFVVWRHPLRDGSEPASRQNRLGAWVLSLYLVAVWLLLLTGSAKPFYIGVILLLLPIVIRCARLGVNHVLRPAGSEGRDDAVPSLAAVSLERGLQAALLIGGAYLIAWIQGLDFGAMAAGDSLATRLLRGTVHAVVIVLLADFAWHLARAWIDSRLAAATSGGQAEGERARRQARLLTLLPIFKNVLFVALFVMAALMALSALGIEIGPLIAGAGVVGVAIGFGAQTLVKDIISGMFYLLDDAFRVGEYIVSGSYKGTVESFSLRSIKLRHHRGYLYTVPFGELGAVQNMSRDWVIDIMNVGVTYDSDIGKVKRIIKQVGKELAQDEEFKPHIIETLKMQGVEQFGDFAIQIRMKMMTKPGEQFVIRRRAYAMIKQAFDENGIKFAFPTVQVAGGGEASAAVAHTGLELATHPSGPV
ncbi:MAG: mechanosensitive ion channel family protein [Kiloniellales bacterium]